MKIAFFFENRSHEGRDLRHITEGNPGMAATPYLFFLIGHLLSVRDNGLQVTLLLTHRMTFADGVHVELASNLTEAYDYCCREGIDYLVIKHNTSYLHTICRLPVTKPTRFLVWCHNFVTFPRLTRYARNPLVARLITVGREQADIYRDHRAFLKTDWIYNCVNTHTLRSKAKGLLPNRDRRPVVTYIGAVIPGKGFHVLAKAWPKVLRQVPDAELYVIGNGRLYGDRVELGPWQLAEKHYEARFMHWLQHDGKLLPGVHLMGILGEEKYDILAKTKVGVPNPSGLTETFCNSAVEMQMMGAVIASKRCVGYMDTVKNGRLVDNPGELARCIVDCLKNEGDDRQEETLLSIEENFSEEAVIRQWERLFREALPQHKRLQEPLPMVNPDYELKSWKEFMRKVKERHPWMYAVVPSIGFFTEGWKALKWAVWKRTILR